MSGTVPAWKNPRLGLYEPPPAHRGPIARKVMYFLASYPTLLRRQVPPDELRLLGAWHLEHGADTDERRLDDTIYRLQGNRNPFVSQLTHD